MEILSQQIVTNDLLYINKEHYECVRIKNDNLAPIKGSLKKS